MTSHEGQRKELFSSSHFVCFRGSSCHLRAQLMLALLTRPIPYRRLRIHVGLGESDLLQFTFREELGLIRKPRRIRAVALAVREHGVSAWNVPELHCQTPSIAAVCHQLAVGVASETEGAEAT